MIFDIIFAALMPWDFYVVGFGLLAALIMGYLIENPPKRRPSVTSLMSFYRRAWMLAFVDRDPRIFDAQILGSLRQSTAFFGSTSLISIGGLLAMMGSPDRLVELTHALTQSEEATSLKLQIKLAFAALFLVYAFLKFVWSSRLFGYCAVLMAAVPNDPNHPQAIPRAIMAGEINIRAALSFNRGLRAMYFALASLAWLAGAPVLLAAFLVTLWMLWSREFSSQASALLKAGVSNDD
jgi:uncharacterized membrane protein